jgi:4-amino-4-deoxy-L-arabinose transferase-like glycosyltransferase
VAAAVRGRDRRGTGRHGDRVRRAGLLVAAAAFLPRLAVVLHERERILTAYTEKSDDFARVFVHSGTYGLVPGVPSAYTQPLYGWFLIPVYWIFGRHWWSLGIIQALVAVVTALLVLRIGRRFLSERYAAGAAIVATLNPYLVWHDVHVNREIIDQVVLAGLVLATLAAADRRSWRLGGLVGLLCGIAILGNTRLALLPVVLAVYLVWRTRVALPAALVVVVAGIAVLPWLVRNDVNVGCWTLTTDARSLWKANNAATYDTLAEGKWIDAITGPPGRPPTPEDAENIYNRTGRVVRVDECAQMQHYEHLVIQFWKHHQREKAKLAAQATSLLWDPRASETTNRPGQGSRIDTARRWGEGIYMSIVYALAIVGIFVLPRAVAALVLIFLAYQTIAAAVFVGTTRYRVVTDFLLAVAASAAVRWLLARRRAALR